MIAAFDLAAAPGRVRMLVTMGVEAVMFLVAFPILRPLSGHLSRSEMTRMIRQISIVIPPTGWLVLAAITMVGVPGSVADRLLLIGAEGVSMAACTTLGLLAARISK